MTAHDPRADGPHRRAGPWTAAILVLAAILPAGAAKIELSTLPERAEVDLTIYKDIDLTLVRESRTIRFHEGRNDIAFSWADTQIDPTSVRIHVAGEGIELAEVSYPPEQPNTLVWEIQAQADGEHQVEVRYFTSGIRWSAAYQVILAPDESVSDFSGFFLVANYSGETYENAQVALLTGGVRMVEQVVQLAQEGLQATLDRRAYGTHAGRGGYGGGGFGGGMMGGMGMAGAPGMMGPGMGPEPTAAPPTAPAEMAAEAEEAAIYVAGAQTISEHHQYDISTRQDLRNGWTTRLEFTRAPGVPVETLCRWYADSGEMARYVYKLTNDEESGFDNMPLPAGPIRVYKRDAEGRLTFIWQSHLEYIGPGQEAEIDAGPALDAVVEFKNTRYAKGGHVIDNDGAIDGYQELFEYELVLRNRRGLPATFEATAGLRGLPFELINADDVEREGNTIKWTLPLEPDAEWKRDYAVRYFNGQREPVTIPAPEVLEQ